MATPEQNALKRAANIIANEAKVIAGRFSRRIPATIKYPSVRGMTADITAGGTDSIAPHAGMFERPGARHPLFGNKGHWYTQPYRPFLEEAAERKSDEAMQKFADDVIEIALKKAGL